MCCYERGEWESVARTERVRAMQMCIRDRLEGLDWLGNPWPQSHQGAGVFAALTIAGEADAAWQNAYFAWLREHCDPKWGMSLRGAVDAQKAPAAHHLYGWFHYIFNHESAHRPIPYAAKLVDTCIELYKACLLYTSRCV